MQCPKCKTPLVRDMKIVLKRTLRFADLDEPPIRCLTCEPLTEEEKSQFEKVYGGRKQYA